MVIELDVKCPPPSVDFLQLHILVDDELGLLLTKWGVLLKAELWTLSGAILGTDGTLKI